MRKEKFRVGQCAVIYSGKGFFKVRVISKPYMKNGKKLVKIKAPFIKDKKVVEENINRLRKCK